MRRILISLFTVFFLLESLPQTSTTAASSERLPFRLAEPDSGSVVCPPGVYATCTGWLPASWSIRVLWLKSLQPAFHIPFCHSQPTSPLPNLNDIPYHYFKVTNEGAPLYSSLEDAANNQPSRQIAPGYELYVSYVGVETDQNGTSYYRLRSGYLIGMDGGRQAVPTFQGLAFSSQPPAPIWLGDGRDQPPHCSRSEQP